MKTYCRNRLEVALTVLNLSLLFAVAANAQAPTSIAGNTFGVKITSGTSPFASSGYFLFLPANSPSSSYQVIGIAGVTNSTGTYLYSAPDAIGTANLTDSLAGSIYGSFDFATAFSGSNSLIGVTNGGNQSGDFVMFTNPVPNSINGKSFLVTVKGGSGAFASSGAFILTTAASGSYTITALVGTGIYSNSGINSSGTYSYSKLNTSCGGIQLNSLSSVNGTAYVAFTNSVSGGYYLTSPYGYQVGLVFILNYPAIAITSPTSASTYATNVSNINLGGTASDGAGFSVTQVTWSNNRGGSGTASGTTSWSITGIALQGGTNVITVTAYDTAGNINQATLTVVIPDTTPPIISITSPTSGSTYATNVSSINLGGTASDNVGVTQVTWSNNRGGSGTASGTTSWSITGIALQSGTNVITVTAYDTAGNTNQAALAVPYDTTPPTVNITLQTLCSFNSTNGANPIAALTLGNDGNFYGTTEYGGSSGDGTVFQVTTNDTLTTLYSFTGGWDGAYPNAALTLGNDGNFYGTTCGGGGSGDGAIFRVTTNGTLTPLYSFTGGTNGATPNALTLGNDGNFYGTTEYGGQGVEGGWFYASSLGTVFKVTTNGTLTTLVSFNESYATGGAYPNAALTLGSDGDFYGTTEGGGGSNDGTVFKVTTSGTLTYLGFFNGINGAEPNALTLGNDGNFYGTTSQGGSSRDGTVFKVTTSGGLTCLVSFNGTNGASPNALTLGNGGNFYGTTLYGGSSGYGTVFQVTTNGTLTTLVSFNGGNGEYPYAALTLGNDGNFYGTTGGVGGYGTVFRLLLPPPSLTLQFVSGYPLLNLNGMLNNNFVVQYCTNLANPNWINLLSVTNLPASSYEFLDSAGVGQSARFYRAFMQ